MITINYWAVLLSAVASMIVGSVWYGALFGKLFIAANGWDKKTPEERKAMMKGMQLTYLWQFLASVVMFYVLAVIIYGLGVVGVMGGIYVALLVWIGFVVTLSLSDALWSGKKILFWLSTGNMFITLLIAGAIIGGWK